MNDALSVQDVIKNSILKAEVFQMDMTWQTIISIIISLLISLLMGLLIFFIYQKTYRGVVFSKSFAMTLIGMTVLTCMIILAISTNIILSLGMVGALSIVRYRTAIKEPFDLLFLFWAISAGIAIGAHMYFLAAVTAGIIIFLLFVIVPKGASGQVYIMIIHYDGDDIGDEIKKVLRETKYVIKSKTMRGDTVEIAVEVYVKNDNLAFAEQIRNLENVEDLTLVQYNGDYNG